VNGAADTFAPTFSLHKAYWFKL